MNSLARFGALTSALGVTLFTSTAGTSRRSLQDHDVVIDKELLISAIDVVDSPRATYPGPWSFGYLMNEAFTKEKAPARVAEWLRAWADGLDGPNGDPHLPARAGVNELLIEPWKKADGYRPEEGGEWLPNFRNAPFQLLAIANRMDLSVPPDSFTDPNLRPRSGAAYYGSPRGFDSGGGEGRLIFAVTDQQGRPLEPGVTLIFEYGLDINGRHERLLDWAMAWHALGAHEGHDAAYCTSLAEVTRAFTDRRSVNEAQVRTPPAPEEERVLSPVERLRIGRTTTATQLMRIRTNDGAFGGTREFREFAWTTEGLTPAPLAGTPDEVFFRKGTTENRWMVRWLRQQLANEVIPAVARDDPQSTLPTSFALPASARIRGDSIPVAARVAPVPGNDDSYHWDGWGLSEQELRRSFSMQTCCGCHCGDTNTAFFHIAPRQSGEAAPLSKFLRTDSSRWRARDPDNGRRFSSDEMNFRKKIFEAALAPDLGADKIRELRESRRRAVH